MAETVQVGGTTFTPEEYQQALAYGDLVARSKPTAGEPGKAQYDRLVSIDPAFRRQIQQGVAQTIALKEAGLPAGADPRLIAIQTQRQADLLTGQAVTGRNIQVQTTELPPRQITPAEAQAVMQERQQAIQQAKQTQESKAGPVKEFISAAFSKESEQFVGVRLRPQVLPFGLGGKPDVTYSQIKDYSRQGGLPGKVVGEFIPTTPGQIVLGAGLVYVVPTLPAVVRIGGEATLSGIGIKSVFETSLPTEKRIAGGILGTIAGVAAFSEALPFIKGGINRLRTDFKPIQTQPEGYKVLVIQEVKGGGVKLIPKGKAGGGEAFGLKKADYYRLVGKDQQITTSQVDFFKVGQKVTLQREFFVTPQDPVLQIARTRVSRLALTEPFKFQPNAQISFKLFPSKPQIGIFADTSITKAIQTGAFKIGQQSGALTGELEATAGIGQTITTTSQIGVTTIKGQAVSIFSAQLGGVSSGGGAVAIPSTASVVTVPITSAATPALATSLYTQPKTPVITTPSTPRSTTTIITTTPSGPTSPPRIPYGGTPTTITIPQYNLGTPSAPTTPLSPPTQNIIPTSTSTPLLPRSGSPLEVPRTEKLRLKLPKAQPKKQTGGLFKVELRRFGVFKPIGTARTQQEAINIGRQAAGSTLAATFRIKGASPMELPGFKTRQTKEGVLFIEQPKYRLSTGTEIKEIQSFGLAKPKKKKKKGGKKK